MAEKMTLIIKGRCMTMAEDKIYDWMAVSGDRIVSLGFGEEYKNQFNTWNMLINAEGKTVLPGFIDSHFQLVQTALNSSSLDLSEARSFDDIGQLILAAGRRNPEQSIRAIHLNEQNLKEKRLPDRSVLDAYWNESSVWLNSVEYQTSVLNTYALLHFKIPFGLDGIECDGKQMPTGVFRRSANATLRGNILRSITDFSRIEPIEAVMQDLTTKGLTTVNAMEGGYLYCDRDAECIYEQTQRKEPPVDIELFYQTMDLERIQELGLKRVGGNFYLDGTFSARTAALSFEYADCPGKMGSLRFSQEKLNEFVLECYKKELQLAVHTIGERAIEQALNAHEYALYQTGNLGLRHRLEHVELPTQEQLVRAKQLGLIFSMQPTYEVYWGAPGQLYEQRLGKAYLRTNPFDKIVAAGIPICAGSDSDVTSADPMLGIYGAVNHPVAEHRVSLREALKMYTVHGAYAIHKEHEKGTLEPGKLADIIILDQDIEQVPVQDLKDVSVKVTIKSGRVIYNEL